MRGEYTELSCPFCVKGMIQCLYIPSSFSVRQTRSRVLHGNQKQKNPEIWLIKSGCSTCGKSQEEVEKELKSRNII